MEIREMADWRKLAMSAILSDGTVDENEVKLLQKELKGADGKFDEEGVQFLLELRAAASKKAKSAGTPVSDAFEKFFFKVVGDNVLKEGAIDAKGVNWLRTNMLTDKKIDDKQMEFLTGLNKKAKTKHADFEKLYTDYQGYHAKANKK
jgi:hypothetical protein